MAPRTRERSGWMSVLELFLPHYGGYLSRGYASPSQATDYGGVAEAAGLPAPAECHRVFDLDYLPFFVSPARVYNISLLNCS